MLKLIKKAIMDYLTSLAVNGGVLQGVKKVKSGPVETLAFNVTDYPCVTVHFRDGRFAMPRPGQLDVDAFYVVELFIAEMKLQQGPSEDDLLDLILSDDATKGLLAALNGKRNLDVGSKKFLVQLDNDEVVAALGPGKPFTFSASMVLHVTRWGVRQ